MIGRGQNNNILLYIIFLYITAENAADSIQLLIFFNPKNRMISYTFPAVYGRPLSQGARARSRSSSPHLSRETNVPERRCFHARRDAAAGRLMEQSRRE